MKARGESSTGLTLHTFLNVMQVYNTYVYIITVGVSKMVKYKNITILLSKCADYCFIKVLNYKFKIESKLINEYDHWDYKTINMMLIMMIIIRE